MIRSETWLDEKLDELSSRGVSCSKSFTDELEERMMKERLNTPNNRRWSWTTAILLLVIGVGGGAYASGGIIQDWIFGPFFADSDGTIRNSNGEKVGENRVLEDGTKQFSVTVGDSRFVAEGGHLPEGSYSFSFQPNEDGKVNKSSEKQE